MPFLWIKKLGNRFLWPENKKWQNIESFYIAKAGNCLFLCWKVTVDKSRVIMRKPPLTLTKKYGR